MSLFLQHPDVFFSSHWLVPCIHYVILKRAFCFENGPSSLRFRRPGAPTASGTAFGNKDGKYCEARAAAVRYKEKLKCYTFPCWRGEWRRVGVNLVKSLSRIHIYFLCLKYRVGRWWLYLATGRDSTSCPLDEEHVWCPTFLNSTSISLRFVNGVRMQYLYRKLQKDSNVLVQKTVTVMTCNKSNRHSSLMP